MTGPAADYARIFFSSKTLGFHIASWLLRRRPRARSSFAPRASLLMSSVFWVLSMYRCEVNRLSSRRSKPAFHDLISCALGSPAVDDAADSCEGAMDGVSVGAVLYVERRVEARLPVDCDFLMSEVVIARVCGVCCGVAERKKREEQRVYSQTMIVA